MPGVSCLLLGFLYMGTSQYQYWFLCIIWFLHEQQPGDTLPESSAFLT